ncbi:hypothetical protein CLOM_g17454 [Closterium sp. NIES-68]|nr:hypothetical protein CLOM_g17454 [Closterium sp. NIES-68]
MKEMLQAGRGFAFTGLPLADSTAAASLDVSLPLSVPDVRRAAAAAAGCSNLQSMLRHTGGGGERGMSEEEGEREGGMVEEEEEEEEGREEDGGEGGVKGKKRAKKSGGEGGKTDDGYGMGVVGVMQDDNSESEKEDGEEDIDDGVAYNEGMRVEGKKRKGLGENGGSEYEKEQAELMRLAFAGDDVAAEFEAEKERVVEKEVGREEGPVTLPGWGQWEEVQRRKGAPKWIEEEREAAKRRRMDAVKQRADSKLKHVIVSEKDNKKIEKFFVPELPNMYRNRAEYARSIRTPIGRDFNTEAAFRSMTRPAVMKPVGVVIKPVRYVKNAGPAEEPTKNAAGAKKGAKGGGKGKVGGKAGNKQGKGGGGGGGGRDGGGGGKAKGVGNGNGGKGKAKVHKS